MAISNKFNPLAQFVVKKSFKSGGKEYQPGELVAAGTERTRLQSLYEQGFVWYGWQQKRAIEEVKAAAEAKKAVEAKKAKKVKDTPEDKPKKTKTTNKDK